MNSKYLRVVMLIALAVIFTTPTTLAEFIHGVQVVDSSGGIGGVRNGSDNIVLLSETDSIPEDIVSVEMDEFGSVIRADQWQSANRDNLKSACFAADGSCLVAGSTIRSGSTDSEQTVFKLDSLSNLSWARALDFSMLPGDMFVDSNSAGEIYTVCELFRPAAAMDLSVTKLASDGTHQWSTTLSDGYFNYWVEGITATSDGGCLVTGYMGSTGLEDGTVFKLSATGTLEWHKQFGFLSEYFGVVKGFESDGGYLIFGKCPWTDDRGIYMMQLDINGDLLWCKSLVAPGQWIYPYYATKLGNNEFLTSSSYYDGSENYSLISRISVDGSSIWSKYVADGVEYSDSGFYYSSELSSGDYLFAGATRPVSQPDSILAAARMSTSGEITGCSLLQDIVLQVVDLTADVQTFTRPVSTPSTTVTIEDIASDYTMSPVSAQEFVVCDGVLVPALDLSGLLICLIGLTIFIIRRQ